MYTVLATPIPVEVRPADSAERLINEVLDGFFDDPMARLWIVGRIEIDTRESRMYLRRLLLGYKQTSGQGRGYSLRDVRKSMPVLRLAGRINWLSEQRIPAMPAFLQNARTTKTKKIR